MSTSIPGLFVRSVFSGASSRPTSQKAAAAGFSAIFASIVAKQMREAMVGEDNGPMGIAGGASGDIYGAFLDQAMGKALAGSPSMRQLNEMIERELEGPNGKGAKAIKLAAATTAMSNLKTYAEPLVPHAGMDAASEMSLFETEVSQMSDAHGPLVPPPPATTSALNLLPPTPED